MNTSSNLSQHVADLETATKLLRSLNRQLVLGGDGVEDIHAQNAPTLLQFTMGAPSIVLTAHRLKVSAARCTFGDDHTWFACSLSIIHKRSPTTCGMPCWPTLTQLRRLYWMQLVTPSLGCALCFFVLILDV